MKWATMERGMTSPVGISLRRKAQALRRKARQKYPTERIDSLRGVPDGDGRLTAPASAVNRPSPSGTPRSESIRSVGYFCLAFLRSACAFRLSEIPTGDVMPLSMVAHFINQSALA